MQLKIVHARKNNKLNKYSIKKYVLDINMIDIYRIDKDTLDLMINLSKSDKEYCIPLIDTHGSISAYDVIEGSEHSVCFIDPSLVAYMVAQFHNHPREKKVIISDKDMLISYQHNMSLIIGAPNEIKLFEPKPKNTFMKDYQSLQEIQNKIIPLLDEGKDIEIDLKNAFKSAYQKTLSNFNVVLISFPT